ncbi:MAG: flagellar M-ring protein FliF, partial [Aeromonas veronii]
IRPLVKHLVRTQQQPDMEMNETEEDLEPTVGLSMRSDDLQPPVTLSSGLIHADNEIEPHFTSLDLDSLPEPGSELEVQLKHLQLLVEKDTARVAEVFKAWVSGNEQR